MKKYIIFLILLVFLYTSSQLLARPVGGGPIGGSGGSTEGLVSAVLDCASGDCDSLIDAPFAFTSTDTTPDVSNGAVFITANGAGTTINDFDTDLNNGKMIFVIVNDANTTFDFTASGLEGIANDYLATNGEVLVFIYTTVDNQWHYCGFPKTINNVTFAGFTATRTVFSDASGYLAAGDAGGDIEVTGGDLEVKANAIEYSETSGSSKSLTPVTGTCTGFAAGFTGENLYGGTYIVDTDNGDLQLPLMLVDMNFCIITLGAIQVVADTNGADGYLMDGTTNVEGKNLTNLSTAGDIACFQYYTADDWLITTNGWSPEA